MGERLTFYVVHAARGHAKSIEALEKAPPVPAGLAGNAYACFRDLGGERSIGLGVGALPYRAIAAWAWDHDIRDGDGFDDLLIVVQHLDGIWLKDSAAKVKQRSDASKKQTPKSGKIERTPPSPKTSVTT